MIQLIQALIGLVYIYFVVTLVSPKAIFWHRNAPEKQTRKNAFFQLFLPLLVLSFLINWSVPKESHPTSNEATEMSNVTQKKWVEVLKFEGNGMKSSQSFSLNGGESRIKYDYNGKQIGMFAAYVLPVGHDIMVDGGIPDVMVNNIKEVSESYLQKAGGNYYLHINATGKWSVSIEELR